MMMLIERVGDGATLRLGGSGNRARFGVLEGRLGQISDMNIRCCKRAIGMWG